MLGLYNDALSSCQRETVLYAEWIWGTELNVLSTVVSVPLGPALPSSRPGHGPGSCCSRLLGVKPPRSLVAPD